MFFCVNILSRGNYMNFKKLDIPNFHYNPDMTSEMGSIYYDSDFNEDDWYELIWDCEENDYFFIKCCTYIVNLKYINKFIIIKP